MRVCAGRQWHRAVYFTGTVQNLSSSANFGGWNKNKKCAANLPRRTSHLPAETNVKIRLRFAAYRQLDVRNDIAVQLHRNLIFADELNRFRELNLAAVNGETLRRKRF